jgi:hypothetical protein
VRIEILPEAQDDLLAGFRFYEAQARGLGSYFRESILEDVDSLAVRGGVHEGFRVSLQSKQAFPLCDLLSRRCECGPRPRDPGLP